MTTTNLLKACLMTIITMFAMVIATLTTRSVLTLVWATLSPGWARHGSLHVDAKIRHPSQPEWTQHRQDLTILRLTRDLPRMPHGFPSSEPISTDPVKTLGLNVGRNAPSQATTTAPLLSPMVISMSSFLIPVSTNLRWRYWIHLTTSPDPRFFHLFPCLRVRW